MSGIVFSTASVQRFDVGGKKVSLRSRFLHTNAVELDSWKAAFVANPRIFRIFPAHSQRRRSARTGPRLAHLVPAGACIASAGGFAWAPGRSSRVLGDLSDVLDRSRSAPPSF